MSIFVVLGILIFIGFQWQPIRPLVEWVGEQLGKLVQYIIDHTNH